MKKLLAGFLAVALVMVGVSSHAKALAAQTDVTGVVTANFAAVANAQVTVTCKSDTASDMTDASGSYLVSFPATNCPFGSTVKVFAQKGGMSGTASGTVEGKTTKLNLAIVNVAIPEYGVVGALTAGVAGIGAIVYTRRRQGQASQL